MRKTQTAWMFAGALSALSLGPCEAADAPRGADPATWARWQGRLSLVTLVDPWQLGVESAGRRLGSASLMSDYYFAVPPNAPPGRIGGLRLTSGLLYGARGPRGAGLTGFAGAGPLSLTTRAASRLAASGADTANDASTAPYLGIGYTGLRERSGWAFSADFGIVAQSPYPAPRLGRAAGTGTGGQSLDELVRDMRLTPLLQLGVSYAF